jgi:hypothetical protein
MLLAGAAVGAEVLVAGAAVRLQRSDPTRAAAIAPYDARLALAAARAAMDSGAQPGSPQVRRLTRRALERDVTLPAALELAALDAGASGDAKRQARLFQLSDAISRRSLATRLWLIQHAVDAGDVPGALRHFDIALRTSPAAPDVLFPVLARAASDPGLAGPLAALLDRPSDWRLAFLHYAITDGHAAADMARVIAVMRDRDAVRTGKIDQVLVGQLVSERRFAEALQAQDALDGRPARPGLVRDPDFSDPHAAYPFGWGLSESGDAGAARGVVSGRPALTYESLPGGAGPVANQLLVLQPGGYRLAVQTAASPGEGASTPYWTVTCGQDGGPQIALLEQPMTAGAWAARDFTVPADCPAQWLALTLRSSDVPTRSGAIAAVNIQRR